MIQGYYDVINMCMLSVKIFQVLLLFCNVSWPSGGDTKYSVDQLKYWCTRDMSENRLECLKLLTKLKYYSVCVI